MKPDRQKDDVYGKTKKKTKKKTQKKMVRSDLWNKEETQWKI